MNDYFGSMLSPADASKQHHLLRHSLPVDERGESVLRHFDTDTVSEAFKSIKKMSQRDLQAKFKAIYGAKTFSNNNNWLRRKLFEAIGVDPSKGAGKKPAGAVQKRRKAPNKAARPAAPKGAAFQELDHSVAEALLALGDLACAQMSEEDEESQPSASAGTSSGGVPTDDGYDTKQSVSEWGPGESSPAGDREVPGNREKPSPFAQVTPEPQVSTQSLRQEEEGETEAAPSNFYLAAPTSRANSSNLAPPPLDPSELSHMTSNVGQLYAWLLARQQHQMASAAAGTAMMPDMHRPGHSLLPTPMMSMGAGYGHPLMHALPGPMPAYAMLNGLMPGNLSAMAGQLPMAPPLFNMGKGI